LRYSIAQTRRDVTLRPSLMRPDLIERRIRQISAWIILCLLLEGELGLAWDRQWHDRLGRDQFWIPPHIMMYVGVGATGLIALFVVLLDTLRYYQKKPGVDDSSTIGVLRYFHAPLGFILLGFGTLTDLIAAPFDNYWHQLYGVDVTLWTPFHLMGALGAIMAGLGIIYAFASEAAHERESRAGASSVSTSHRFLGLNGPEWALIILLAAFQEFILPALTAFIPIVFGTLQILTYPLILVVGASTCLIGVYMCIRKPGITFLTVLILWPLSVLTEIFVPLALRFMAAHLGLTWRFGFAPVFNLTLAILPLYSLVCAAIIEAAVYWQRRSTVAPHSGRSEFKGVYASFEGENNGLRGAWLLGALFAVPAVVMPPAIVYLITHLAPFIILPPDVLHVLQPGWLSMLLSLPLAMLVGAIVAFVGTVLGDIWYWNKQ
jgi:hypothetical protein